MWKQFEIERRQFENQLRAFENNVKAHWRQSEYNLKPIWKYFESNLKTLSKQHEDNSEAICKQFERKSAGTCCRVLAVWQQFENSLKVVWSLVGRKLVFFIFATICKMLSQKHINVKKNWYGWQAAPRTYLYSLLCWMCDCPCTLTIFVGTCIPGRQATLGMC